MLDIWLRLYTHALLVESRIFPDVELCDRHLDCSFYGFTDVWKGKYRGEPMCFKVIRTQDRAPLMKTAQVGKSPILPRHTQ